MTLQHFYYLQRHKCNTDNNKAETTLHWIWQLQRMCLRLHFVRLIHTIRKVETTILGLCPQVPSLSAGGLWGGCCWDVMAVDRLMMALQTFWHYQACMACMECEIIYVRIDRTESTTLRGYCTSRWSYRCIHILYIMPDDLSDVDRR